MNVLPAIFFLAATLAEPSDMPASHCQAPGTEQGKQIAQDFFRAWFTAVEAGDAGATLVLLAPGFVVKPPIGPAIADATVFRQGLEAMHARVGQRVQWRIEEAERQGQWAWARITETARHTPKAGGEAATLTGSHLVILKCVGARWLLYRDQMSLDALPGNRGGG